MFDLGLRASFSSLLVTLDSERRSEGDQGGKGGKGGRIGRTGCRGGRAGCRGGRTGYRGRMMTGLAREGWKKGG